MSLARSTDDVLQSIKDWLSTELHVEQLLKRGSDDGGYIVYLTESITQPYRQLLVG